MADNKKYYYIKLKENFFETEEMIVLESMPDGYKYSNILLKMYLKSLKHDGKVMLNERIPYNSEMLASVTRHSVGDVEKAIKMFRELGLIETFDNGTIFISDIQQFIGRSSTEAERKKEYRERIKTESLLISGQMSGQTSDVSTPEIELEKEIEIELEIDIEKDNTSKQASMETLFSEIWKLYPKKTMRKEALAAFKKSVKKGTSIDAIKKGVETYVNHLEANKNWLKPMDGGRWFQKERWNDEYDAPKKEVNPYEEELGF